MPRGTSQWRVTEVQSSRVLTIHFHGPWRAADAFLSLNLMRFLLRKAADNGLREVHGAAKARTSGFVIIHGAIWVGGARPTVQPES